MTVTYFIKFLMVMSVASGSVSLCGSPPSLLEKKPPKTANLPQSCVQTATGKKKEGGHLAASLDDMHLFAAISTTRDAGGKTLHVDYAPDGGHDGVRRSASRCKEVSVREPSFEEN